MIRLLFTAAGVPFKDTSIPFSEWPKKKPTTVNKQLPFILEIKDGEIFELGQSMTILRYLGRKFGFCGKNEREHASIDMISETILEFRLKFNSVAYFPNFLKDETLTNNHFSKVVPDSLLLLESWLDKNPSGFFVGDKLSYCDIIAFDCFFVHSEIRSDLFHSYPKIHSFMEKISKLPHLEEYLKKRRPTDFNKR